MGTQTETNNHPFSKGDYLFSKQTALLADVYVNRSHVFSSFLEEKTDGETVFGHCFSGREHLVDYERS